MIFRLSAQFRTCVLPYVNMAVNMSKQLVIVVRSSPKVSSSYFHLKKNIQEYPEPFMYTFVIFFPICGFVL